MEMHVLRTTLAGTPRPRAEIGRQFRHRAGCRSTLPTEALPPQTDIYSDRLEVSTQYRVTIWEQPVVEGIPLGQVGWGEITFDLVDVENVQEAIRWAERQLTLDEGCYSRSGKAIHDREYVLYVRVPREGHFLQIAGWNPTVGSDEHNLRRTARTATQE